jgi:hypothetical protein
MSYSSQFITYKNKTLINEPAENNYISIYYPYVKLYGYEESITETSSLTD